jgi:F-type H+-transporting ATPase subunit delta
MTVSAVAKRYAEALADVVTASASALQPQVAVRELREFEEAVRSSPELYQALVSPAIPIGRKRAVVNRMAELLGCSRITRNFLLVLIDHRRIPELSPIVQTFEVVLEERLGFARAEIASAGELNEMQRSTLNRKLEELTGKRIRMRFTVDQSLIGGVVARIGSTVYDGSLRGQLSSLGRRLTAED